VANLTITVDADVLRKARMRAIERGTSVNAVLREHLEAYSAGGADRATTIQSLVARSRRAASARGKAKWTRDSLHER
jgi:hypothetical protein